jgi:hypothetical protein
MNRRSLTPSATQTQPPLELGLGRLLPQPRARLTRIAEIAGMIFATLVVLSLWLVSR